MSSRIAPFQGWVVAQMLMVVRCSTHPNIGKERDSMPLVLNIHPSPHPSCNGEEYVGVSSQDSTYPTPLQEGCGDELSQLRLPRDYDANPIMLLTNAAAVAAVC